MTTEEILGLLYGLALEYDAKYKEYFAEATKAYEMDDRKNGFDLTTQGYIAGIKRDVVAEILSQIGHSSS